MSNDRRVSCEFVPTCRRGASPCSSGRPSAEAVGRGATGLIRNRLENSVEQLSRMVGAVRRAGLSVGREGLEDVQLLLGRACEAV